MKKNARVHVAVALIIKDQQILISFRAAHVHQGGLWEFPGGKLENTETAEQALVREIKEELAIDITSVKSFMTIQHDYADKSVLLEIMLVDDFNGNPQGAEGQEIKWLPIKDLKTEDFPVANRAIIHRLQCSEQYLITGKFSSLDAFRNKLSSALQQSDKLVQLRYKAKESGVDYHQLTRLAAEICQQYQTVLLLNTTPEEFQHLSAYAQGLHLNSSRLFNYNERPVSMNKILSVSCHSAIEVSQAKKLQADIILISPLKETSSHPGVKGIGWDSFKELSEGFEGVVYALGGMTKKDIKLAKKCGAQGVAAISAFWNI